MANNRNAKDALYITPVGTVSYDEYVRIPYKKGRHADETAVVKPNGKGEAIGVGAYNTEDPLFFRVSIVGRPGCTVFPTDGAKKYYTQCLRASLKCYPIEIESYSVVHNGAFFVIASYDQTPVSYRRYFDLVNSTYAKYFNETFGYSGFVFRSKLYVKRLKEAGDVAAQIVSVDKQPTARHMHNARNYIFCSSGEPEATAITSRSAFLRAFGKQGASDLNNAYRNAHVDRGSIVDLLNVGLLNREKLDDVIENTLVDYGCYTKKAVPNNLMHRIIALISENSGAPFDKICSKLAIPKAQRGELLAKVMGELTIGLKHSFDASYELLNAYVPDKRALAVDVVIEISDRLGYSVDKIFAMLGFAYCAVIDGQCVYYNDELLVQIVLKMADTRGMLVEGVIAKLGIIDTFEDPARRAYVAKLCRSRTGSAL